MTDKLPEWAMKMSRSLSIQFGSETTGEQRTETHENIARALVAVHGASNEVVGTTTYIHPASIFVTLTEIKEILLRIEAALNTPQPSGLHDALFNVPFIATAEPDKGDAK